MTLGHSMAPYDPLPQSRANGGAGSSGSVVRSVANTDFVQEAVRGGDYVPAAGVPQSGDGGVHIGSPHGRFADSASRIDYAKSAHPEDEFVEIASTRPAGHVLRNDSGINDLFTDNPSASIEKSLAKSDFMSPSKRQIQAAGYVLNQDNGIVLGNDAPMMQSLVKSDFAPEVFDQNLGAIPAAGYMLKSSDSGSVLPAGAGSAASPSHYKAEQHKFRQMPAPPLPDAAAAGPRYPRSRWRMDRKRRQEMASVENPYTSTAQASYHGVQASKPVGRGRNVAQAETIDWSGGMGVTPASQPKEESLYSALGLED